MTLAQKLAEVLERRASLVTSITNAETREALEKIELELRKNELEEKQLQMKIEAEQRAGQDDEEAERTKAINDHEENERRAVDGVGAEQRAYTPGVGFKPIAGADFNQRSIDPGADYEKRGKDLIEERAVTIATGGIILPQHQATDIKGTFNQVSSIVDGVTQKPLIGGESYKRSYVKGYGTGSNTAEKGSPSDADVLFGYADMNKAKITAYSEDTEELEKLSAAAYAMEIEKGIRIAIRKKVAAEIMTGDGSTNHLMGIFNSTVIEAASDIEVDTITNTTLDDIIFSYGGAEDVEDAAVLILNKKDLKAFSQLRSTDGKKIHTIIAKGNTGSIDGIPYIINSNCKAISDATVLADQYCMAYGPLSNYELPVFSDMEVKKSTDYKFKEGMIAHRGVVFLGGNVAAHNGFLRVKKGE